MRAPRVVVTGGHSARHIEPAMNFADALRRLEPTAEITALGTVRGLDTTLIPARGYPLDLIPPVPLPRQLNRALQTPGRPISPAASGACRIVVHEANARPGVANRLAARMTTRVFTAAPGARLAHATASGIPLRPAITGLDRPALRAAARQRFGLRPDGPVLMVTGGSQGAQAINAAVSGAAAALRAAGVQVLHITGPHRAVEVPDGSPVGAPYVVIPYVGEMRYAYAAADFAVCRSGAMTCAELAAVGLPAAYVPLPLRGGEQRLNAKPAVAAGGALLVDDVGLDPAWIEATLIQVLTDPQRIAAMSARASAAGAPDAGVVLARHVLTAVAERRRLAS